MAQQMFFKYLLLVTLIINSLISYSLSLKYDLEEKKSKK
jgi:hypothetical protein